MTDIRKFPIIFEEIVDSVRASWDEENGILPISEFGTYLQLTKTLEIKNRVDDPKYPLIWLVWEASQSKRTYESDLIAKVTPRIFIANFTDANYNSIERYTANFENVLYPLWDLFFKKLNEHPQLGMIYKQDYEDYDHLYWGESLGYNKKENVLFDTLDALEVNFTNDIRILTGAC